MWVKIEEWVGVGEYVFLSFSFFNDVPEVCVCVWEREAGEVWQTVFMLWWCCQSLLFLCLDSIQISPFCTALYNMLGIVYCCFTEFSSSHVPTHLAAIFKEP